MTPGRWVVVLVGVGLVGLMLAHYVSRPDDLSWTDPSQPPPMLAPTLGTSSGRITRTVPYCKDYPGSLSSWPECVVGDV